MCQECGHKVHWHGDVVDIGLTETTSADMTVPLVPVDVVPTDNLVSRTAPTTEPTTVDIPSASPAPTDTIAMPDTPMLLDTPSASVQPVRDQLVPLEEDEHEEDTHDLPPQDTADNQPGNDAPMMGNLAAVGLMSDFDFGDVGEDDDESVMSHDLLMTAAADTDGPGINLPTSGGTGQIDEGLGVAAEFDFGLEDEASYADSDSAGDTVTDPMLHDAGAEFDFGDDADDSDDDEIRAPRGPKPVRKDDDFHTALARGQKEERAGDLEEAEDEYTLAKLLAERDGGEGCMEVGVSLNALGGVRRKLGELEKSEEAYRAALKNYEQTVGPDAGETAAVVNNLAALAGQQNKYTEAKQGYDRALKIVEKALGADSPYVGVAVNNLAHLERRQGHLTEAEKLYKRALAVAEMHETSMGPEGARVLARTHNNLGQLYRVKGDFDLSRRHYNTAASIWRQVCAPGEAALAATLISLAGLSEVRGETDQAREMYAEALVVFRQAKGGRNNFAAVPTMNNLARLLKDANKLADADSMYRDALRIVERATRSDPAKHAPDLVATLSNLGGLSRRKGQLEEAGTLYSKAVAVCSRHYGDEHPATAACSNNLAGLRMQQGQLKEAQAHYASALQITEKTYGSEHPHVAVLYNNLGRCHEQLGDHAKAAALYRRGINVAKAAQKHKDALPAGITPKDNPSSETALGRAHEALNSSVASLAKRQVGRGVLSLGVQEVKDLKLHRIRACSVFLFFEGERRQTRFLPSNFQLLWDERFTLSAPHTADSTLTIQLVGRKVIGAPKVLGETSLLLKDMFDGESTGDEGSVHWFPLFKNGKGKGRAARISKKKTAAIQIRFKYQMYNK